MKHLLIGAALVAFAAAPLAAQGNGHGKAQSGGHGNAAHGPAMKGNKASSSPKRQAAGHGNAGHASGSTAPAKQAARPGHGNSSGSMASAMQTGALKHGNGKGQAKGNGPAKPNPAARMDTAEHGRPSGAHAAGPATTRGQGAQISRANGDARSGPGIKVLPDGRHYYSQREARPTFDFAAARYGPIDGCPPGLAKKYNGCLPPGQAKKRSYAPDWWGYRNVANGPYVYNDGYLLRMSGNSVASYLPLLGGALAVGRVWPSSYRPMPVPRYYVDYYDLGPPGGYRYADNVIYRVDPTTAAIGSIAALLTGVPFQIGSPLPPGYDVYNVPYSYRSQYYDSPTARYRYSDGYVYQVDPTTQLVTAAIELLAA